MSQEISPEELQKLVDRAKAGSSDEFHQLYSLFVKAIFNFIWRLCGAPEEAEDLTQETFLKVYAELPNLRDSGQFKFWLYRIARNEVYQRLRRTKRRPEVSIEPAPVSQKRLHFFCNFRGRAPSFNVAFG